MAETACTWKVTCWVTSWSHLCSFENVKVHVIWCDMVKDSWLILMKLESQQRSGAAVGGAGFHAPRLLLIPAKTHVASDTSHQERCDMRLSLVEFRGNCIVSSWSHCRAFHHGPAVDRKYMRGGMNCEVALSPRLVAQSLSVRGHYCTFRMTEVPTIVA